MMIRCPASPSSKRPRSDAAIAAAAKKQRCSESGQPEAAFDVLPSGRSAGMAGCVFMCVCVCVCVCVLLMLALVLMLVLMLELPPQRQLLVRKELPCRLPSPAPSTVQPLLLQVRRAMRHMPT